MSNQNMDLDGINNQRILVLVEIPEFQPPNGTKMIKIPWVAIPFRAIIIYQGCIFLIKSDSIYFREMESVQTKNGPWNESTFRGFWWFLCSWKELNPSFSTTSKSSNPWNTGQNHQIHLMNHFWFRPNSVLVPCRRFLPAAGQISGPNRTPPTILKMLSYPWKFSESLK